VNISGMDADMDKRKWHYQLRLLPRLIKEISEF